jgi:hypothetical protein
MPVSGVIFRSRIIFGGAYRICCFAGMRLNQSRGSHPLTGSVATPTPQRHTAQIIPISCTSDRPPYGVWRCRGPLR